MELIRFSEIPEENRNRYFLASHRAEILWNIFTPYLGKCMQQCVQLISWFSGVVKAEQGLIVRPRQVTQ